MDQGALFTATALISFISTLLMAFFANYPFSLGMELNAYFAYTVVLGMGYSWEFALTAQQNTPGRYLCGDTDTYQGYLYIFIFSNV